MTVSNRALIPVAIFSSFSTETSQLVNIGGTSSVHLFVSVCRFVCVPLVILRTLMMRIIVGLMGSEAFRSISSRVIPMMDNNTMARSSWFHLDTQTNTLIPFCQDQCKGCHSGERLNTFP